METGTPTSSALYGLWLVQLLVAMLIGTLIWKGCKPAGRPVDDASTNNSDPSTASASLNSSVRAHGELQRRLDRHWQRITTALERENAGGWVDRNPPATDEDIASAEKEAGVEFPAELKWLLRQQDGQESTIEAVFSNGDRLMGAAEIAHVYLMWQDIITDLEQVPAEGERPTKERSTSWWPGLLPFMTDFGGDSVFIDARTSYVYSDFESMVHATNVAGDRLEAPLTFTAWMADYAERLEDGRFHRDSAAGDALWMWEKQAEGEDGER